MEKNRRFKLIPVICAAALFLTACGNEGISYDDGGYENAVDGLEEAESQDLDVLESDDEEVEEDAEPQDPDMLESGAEEIEEEAAIEEETGADWDLLLEDIPAELLAAYGIIEESNYHSEIQGISSIVFCDVDADGVDELLVVYIDGDYSGEYDSFSVWAALYEVEGDEIVQLTEQQIGVIDHWDEMSVRLFFSEQQAAYCIVTAKELSSLHKGEKEFVSELYKISENGIALKRHWTQNSVDNAGASQDDIITEMKRVGIPSMDLNYISYAAEDTESSDGMLLLQNTVIADKTASSANTYVPNFTTYGELYTQNGGNECILSDEEMNLILSRNSSNSIQEEELKISAREAIQVVENLFAFQNGVTVDYGGYISDEMTSGGWAPAVDFTTIEEVSDYVHSMVSDDVYDQYFHEDLYEVYDGQVYLCVSTYGGYMDMNSLEIEKIEGDIYTVSVDEYLIRKYYCGTLLITLQKNGDSWIVQNIINDIESGVNKGYTDYYGEDGDFISSMIGLWTDN